MHRTLSVSIAIVVLGLMSALAPLLASAATIEATATPFTGDALSVSISINDDMDPGNLVITLEVVGGEIGDLRGFFAQVSDESILDGLSVSGEGVTSSMFAANSVQSVGGGNNLNGGGSPCPCDLGIEIGTPGIGANDIQSISFTLSHLMLDLDISLFAGQEFGIRATSVGTYDGMREGSSKLSEVLPIPEPSTATLMLLGLAGLTSRRRRRNRRASV